VKIFFALLLMLGLVSCQEKNLAQKRADHLAESKSEIVIAVAWPLELSKSSLIKGINLAVDEINQSGGILNGRKIRILLKDDGASLTTGRLVAQEIANDPDVAAVIGHLNTYVAIPASSIYARAGIVMITPGSSGQKLTENGNPYVFRSLPNNADQGRQIADYAAACGYKNIAIYYIKNDYGIDLANNFEQRAHDLGLTIVDRRSYSMGGDNYSAVLADWATFLKFDAIFLVGSLPESPQIIRDAREAGIIQPIFGGAGLDSMQLVELGGKQVENVVVFSLFNIHDLRPEVLNFGARYKKKYGEVPDGNAAQGYDTLQLLVHAMTSAQSIVPEKVAAALHSTKDWHGVTGRFTYNEKGDLVAKQMTKVMVRDGEFRFFDTIPPQSMALNASVPTHRAAK
jgi:branched-chain amino acid transport system substrate-binding protein